MASWCCCSISSAHSVLFFTEGSLSVNMNTLKSFWGEHSCVFAKEVADMSIHPSNLLLCSCWIVGLGSHGRRILTKTSIQVDMDRNPLSSSCLDEALGVARSWSGHLLSSEALINHLSNTTSHLSRELSSARMWDLSDREDAHTVVPDAVHVLLALDEVGVEVYTDESLLIGHPRVVGKLGSSLWGNCEHEIGDMLPSVSAHDYGLLTSFLELGNLKNEHRTQIH